MQLIKMYLAATVEIWLLLCYHFTVKKIIRKVVLSMATATPLRANVFLSIVLSVLMFILTCVFIFLLVLRVGNVANVIRNTEITEILYETEISYYITNQLNALPFNDSWVELSDVEDFIRSDAVSNEIGNVAAGYVNAIIDGDLDYYLTAGDIVSIVQNLEPELQDLFDHQMTEADYEHLAVILDDIIDFKGMSVGYIVEDVGIDMKLLRLAVSPVLLWGTGILCAITLLFTFLLHWRRIPDAFLFTGFPVMLSGLLYFAAGKIFANYPHLLGDTLSRLSRYAHGLTPLIIRHGIAFAVAGVVIIVVSRVLLRVTARRPGRSPDFYRS